MENSASDKMKRRKGFFFIFMIAGLFIVSAIVMLLWNALLPALTGVMPVNYWQAMGLLVLSRILFGSFRFGSWPGHPRHFPPTKFREHFMNLDPDERKTFKEEWKSRCNMKE